MIRAMRPNERGLTLTEVTIVGVIAVLVMLTLTSFYFNSQRTWIESSTKAVAQREATLIVEHLSEHLQGANSYNVDATGDSLHHTITMWDAEANQTRQFVWRSSDGRVHELEGPDLNDLGPISTSRVERFQFAGVNSSLVELRALELVSADGDTVHMSSRFKLYNR